MTSCCTSFYEHPVVEMLLGRTWHPGGLQLTRHMVRRMGLGRGRVLDVACGAGASADVLRREFGLDVIGVDARAAGPEVRGEAMRLPFRSATMDGAIVECALSTFEDQPRALAEIRRVLAPGGRLAISDMIVEGALPPEFDGAVAQIACLVKAHGRIGYERLLREAGFGGVEHEDRRADLASFLEMVDERLHAVQMFAGRAVDAGAVRGLLRSALALCEEGRLGYALFVAGR